MIFETVAAAWSYDKRNPKLFSDPPILRVPSCSELPAVAMCTSASMSFWLIPILPSDVIRNLS